jgi:hypothetical protein
MEICLWIRIFPKKYGLLKTGETRKKKIQFAKLKTGLNKWDIINDSKHHIMGLVGLYSSDCKTDHAVSIAENWIFDSNFEFALPWICFALQISRHTCLYA